nr:hypothetical protein BaRGS_025546 [Batillaria attramentaria]
MSPFFLLALCLCLTATVQADFDERQIYDFYYFEDKARVLLEIGGRHTTHHHISVHQMSGLYGQELLSKYCQHKFLTQLNVACTCLSYT